MKILKYISIILILTFICVAINLDEIETFINYRTCGNKKINNALKHVLETTHAQKMNDNDDWQLYLPCNYTDIEAEINRVNLKNNQSIFGISGSDKIASKNNLWIILKNHYKENDIVTSFYPKSYIPTNESDIDLFKNDFKYKRNKNFIIKKNIQQQKGILLSNDYNVIFTSMKSNKYDIIQELLPNPLLVNGRKINLRVYLLIVFRNMKKNFYIHENGFIYYTRKLYNEKILDFDHHITTGYIERQVYEENPLTHKDLYKWLDSNGFNSETLKINIQSLMRHICQAIKPHVCNMENLNGGVSFQLFGCDVAPDNNLECKLIEINKGPDMGFKDERDGNVKKDVMSSIFNLLRLDEDMINPNFDNHFIKVA